MEAIRRLKSGLPLQVAALVGFACLPLAALGAEPPSADEIAAEILRARSPVESLSFTAERMEPADAAGSPMKRVGHETFGFKGDKRYLDWSLSRPGRLTIDRGTGVEEVVTLETAKGAEAAHFDRDGNVRHHDRRTFDGAEFRSQTGGNMGAIETPATKDVLPGSRFDSFYLRCIGWFVPDPMGPTDFEKVRQIRFLPQAFDHGEYVSSWDSVDGQRRVKLSGTLRTEFPPGNMVVDQDELWLAPELGYMLVQRRVSSRLGVFEVHASNPVEVVPGCWIPQECRVIEENSGEPAKTTVLRITSWNSDDIEDGRFRLEFPEGTMIADYSTTIQRGLSLEKPVVSYVADTGEFLDRPMYKIKAERVRLRQYLYIGGAIVVAVGLLWQWRRVARRRRMGPTSVPPSGS